MRSDFDRLKATNKQAKKSNNKRNLTQSYLILNLNNLQQHVSTPKSNLQAEYKGVYAIECIQ
jgi:hypothetical protein